ncbi:MAG: small nuclear ribonucleoprotein [Thermoplasmata archaeon HGW-Thermoplasmata-2]|nr:MAG: small nuclear ribonucleoprotein [Thermoplasmata archaeon HGW-Thermoplasmata-2]
MTRPFDVLNQSLSKRVIVAVRGDREYRGTLEGYDIPHINVILREVEEVERVGKPEEKHTNHRMVVVRGENIVYISP